MKFSEDYVDFAENIRTLITEALWEICCRMFSFLQIPEVKGYSVTMITEKEYLELIEFFSENIVVHVLFILKLEIVCKNNISVKRYCILRIDYHNKTLLFGLNIAFSNCHNSLPKSTIEIWVFSGKVI